MMTQRNNPSNLEKLIKNAKSFASKALILGTIAVTSCDSSLPPVIDSPEETQNNQEDEKFRSKIYQHCIGYWIPEEGNKNDLSEEIAEEVTQITLDALIEYGLDHAAAWTPIIGIIQQIPLAGGPDPSYHFFVKRKEDQSWNLGVDTCSQDEVLVSMRYWQNYSTLHHNGFEIEIYKKNLAFNDLMDSFPLLLKGEETSNDPPNFFVAKKPISLSDYLEDNPLVSEQVFYVGFDYGAVVDVKTNSYNCQQNPINPPNPPQEDFFHETESNDSASTANALPFSSGFVQIKGHLDNPIDYRDIFSFNAAKNSKYKISWTGHGVDADIEIYSDTWHICDDPRQVTCSGLVWCGSGCSKTFEAKSSGEHYIELSGGVSYEKLEGDYEFTLEKLN